MENESNPRCLSLSHTKPALKTLPFPLIFSPANPTKGSKPFLFENPSKPTSLSQIFFSMDATSSSIFSSRFLETPHLLQTPPPSSISAAFRRDGFFKINENLKPQRFSKLEKETTVSISGQRVRAISREISDGGEDEGTSGNGFGLIPDEDHWFDSNTGVDESEERGANESSQAAIPFTSGSGIGGGSRAGLFRTPISGGVQSATSAHDLPRPALAVRNLMEQARFAHLCTVMSRMHHRRAGYPFGSLIDFATDSMGHPIFSLSPLAIHTRNLLADSRCTIVVQIPGWSGLSNARVTIFGDISPLPSDQQEWAHKQYIAKHQQGASQQWSNFYYFRMQNLSDIYFIGGFGTVAWVDVKEYETLQPDKIAVNGGEQNLKELNAIFSKPLKELLSSEIEVDDAALISIDSKGTDIRVRQGAQFNIQRLSFEVGHAVETLEEAKAALHKLISKGSRLKASQ